MRTLRLLCVFTILLYNGLNAQERVFKFFSNKDGLPSNNIFKIRFDQKGFLWIAHDKGISRFDGNTFKNYTNPHQKSNIYTEIYIDRNGRVWMTNLGLQVFYIENDEMKLFRSFDLKYPPTTLRIAFLSNGNMVFNAGGGILEINPKTGKETMAFTGMPVQGFYVENDVVHFLNQSNSKYCTYKNGKTDSFDLSILYPPILVSEDLIVSTYNISSVLHCFSRKNLKKLPPFQLKYNFNHSEMIDGRFMMFTTGDIQEILVSKDTLSSRTVISGHSFTHYAKDALGNEWYATLNDGIMFLPSGNCRRLGANGEQAFHKLVQFRQHAYCISQNNQLYRLDNNTLFKVADFNPYFDQKPIIVFKNLQDQRLVIGHSRFLMLDSMMKMQAYFPEIAVKDLCMDKRRNIYFATSGTVHRHAFNAKTLNKISQTKGFRMLNDVITDYPASGRFSCVAFDTSSNSFYYGGVPGFFVQRGNGQPDEIRDNDLPIYATTIDYSDPYLIVGTIQSGVYILKNGVITGHLSGLNSTLGNTIIKIKHYRDFIWVLSEKGLHTIQMKSMRVQSYSNVGAVNLSNCSDFTISNDQLYLISAQNLYSVDLNEFIKSVVPVPVYFRSIKIGSRILYDFRNLRFRHSENSFAITMEVPAALVLGNVEYEYTLNNSQWFQLNKGQSEIFLNQLSPGTYTLNVRQKGMDNLYALSFVIEKPYWLSWWFYALIVLFATWIIIVLYRNRIRVIREKSRAEIEKFKLEKALQQNILSSIKSQMNPHFLFNALNTIQSYIYLNDKKQAIGYLGKFSVLTRKILDQSNHETITLSEEHETLDLYLQLEKMRFENTLEYTFTFENIPFKDQFRVPPMLIQPYVENAVKHGLMHKPDKRRLNIRFKYNAPQNLIEVYVDDNGIGRKKAMEINEKRGHSHKPFSTEANRTRLEILNNENQNPISVQITDKTDEYGNSTGTMVQINIPVL